MLQHSSSCNIRAGSLNGFDLEGKPWLLSTLIGAQKRPPALGPKTGLWDAVVYGVFGPPLRIPWSGRQGSVDRSSETLCHGLSNYTPAMLPPRRSS